MRHELLSNYNCVEFYPLVQKFSVLSFHSRQVRTVASPSVVVWEARPHVFATESIGAIAQCESFCVARAFSLVITVDAQLIVLTLICRAVRTSLLLIGTKLASLHGTGTTLRY